MAICGSFGQIRLVHCRHSPPTARWGVRGVVTGLLLACFSAVVHAQSDFWRGPIGPFGGGPVLSLSVSPSGRLFAGTRNNGMSWSTNGGSSWSLSRIEYPFPNVGVSTIAFEQDGSVLIGTPGRQYDWGYFPAGYVYRSRDEGLTWSVVFPISDTILKADVFAPAGCGAIFVAAEEFGGGGYLVRSTDDGSTWIHSSSWIPSAMVGTIDGYFFAAVGAQLMRSSDEGSTWVSTTPGTPYCLSVDGAGNVLVGSYGGVYRSTDNGESWTFGGSGLPSDGSLLCIVAQAEDTLYGGTLSSGLFRSSDAGQTWSPSGEGIFRDRVNALAVDSTGMVYVGTEDSGVLRSALPDVWEPVNDGLISGTWAYSLVEDSLGTLIVGTAHDVSRSTDGGSSWEPTDFRLSTSDWTPKWLAVSSTDDIFLSVDNIGVWRSSDDGQRWIQTSFPPSKINRFVGCGASDAVFVSASDGFYRSGDKGQTWSIVGPPEVNSLVTDEEGTMLAAGSQGVLRSIDAGLTWTQTTRTESSGGLRIDDQGRVYVISGGYLWATHDAGLTWSQRSIASGVISMEIAPEDQVFWGFEFDGIWRSLDGGQTFDFEANEGLNFPSTPYTWFPISVLFRSSTGYLFAGTISGLFVTTQPVDESDDGDSTAPVSLGYSLEQNYPNPFNPVTTIRYALPKASLVKSSVYDMLGREVSVLVNENKNAGIHEVTFDGSNRASGVYVYRLQAGDFVQSRKLILLR